MIAETSEAPKTTRHDRPDPATERRRRAVLLTLIELAEPSEREAVAAEMSRLHGDGRHAG